MRTTDFAISLSLRDLLHARGGTSAMFSPDGAYSANTLTPADAVRAQKAPNICVSRPDLPPPTTNAAAAALLSTNRMTGVRLVYKTPIKGLRERRGFAIRRSTPPRRTSITWRGSARQRPDGRRGLRRGAPRHRRLDIQRKELPVSAERPAVSGFPKQLPDISWMPEGRCVFVIFCALYSIGVPLAV